MSDHQLPAPPLPPSVDLRDFDYMPLDVVRLRDAETTVKTKGDEFRCAVILWCAAWHQVPAASLPDDDELLADMAGYGRVVKEWRKVKAGALRGFVKCKDGRLYHRVVAEKAVQAWLAKLKQRWINECGRLKKQAQRKKVEYEPLEFDLWISENCPEAATYLSQGTEAKRPKDNASESPGHAPHVPRETGSKGREGKGYIPVATTSSTRDSEAQPAGDNPRPEGRKGNPPRVAGDTPWQAKLRSEGWRRGMEPRSQESWEDFEARIRTTRNAA